MEMEISSWKFPFPSLLLFFKNGYLVMVFLVNSKIFEKMIPKSESDAFLIPYWIPQSTFMKDIRYSQYLYYTK